MAKTMLVMSVAKKPELVKSTRPGMTPGISSIQNKAAYYPDLDVADPNLAAADPN